MDYIKIIKNNIYIKNIKSDNNVVNINNDNIVNYEYNTIFNWESKKSYNIIKLYEIVNYEYNYLFKNCNIIKFKEFVTQYSNIYDPYALNNDSENESDGEYINEDDYISN
jgi:hypothetical protein